MTVRHVAVDLDAAIDWPGVHDQTVRLESCRPRLRESEKRNILAEPGKILLALPLVLDAEQVDHVRLLHNRI